MPSILKPTAEKNINRNENITLKLNLHLKKTQDNPRHPTFTMFYPSTYLFQLTPLAPGDPRPPPPGEWCAKCAASRRADLNGWDWKAQEAGTNVYSSCSELSLGHQFWAVEWGWMFNIYYLYLFVGALIIWHMLYHFIHPIPFPRSKRLFRVCILALFVSWGSAGALWSLTW